jgi:flagellin-like protein
LNFRKFRKNAKALSPVIATIILIAVTVAVSVVVAAWMGALTIGFMGKSEQASITNVVLANANPAGGAGTYENAQVTVQNTGSATVTINSAYIDSTTGTMYSGTTPAVVTSIPIVKGGSATFNVTVSGVAFANSAQYTVKLMTAKGNTVTNTGTYAGLG